MLAGFILGVILPYMGTIFAYIVPVMLVSLGSLLNFALSRVPKIPSYIKVLVAIYQDSSPGSTTHKYLTSALLILGSILTFMAHSFIPFTGAPIIGLFTSPIAILVSLVVILATMDLILSINENYFEELRGRYGSDVEDMYDDVQIMKVNLGQKWTDLIAKIQAVFEEIAPKLEVLQKEMAGQGKSLSEELDKFFSDQFSDLALYVNDERSAKIVLTESNVNTIKETLEPWKKVCGSLMMGASAGIGTGLGASGIASSAFVPATTWTSIQAFLGIQSGIAVSASTYGMLTVLGPIGLGIGIGAGVFGGAMYGLNQQEKKRLSKFLADVIIAALPMITADGVFHEEERIAVQQLMANSAIFENDRARISTAIDGKNSFDDIINKLNVLREQKQEKVQIKRKLLLSVAWEIAKSDDDIHQKEMELHNRMAKILQVDQETVTEIRRVITPKLKLLPATSSQTVSVENTVQVEATT